MTNMEKAYDLAAIAVRRRLYEQRPADLSILESIRAQDVAVYTGAHYQVQHVLSRTCIGFELDPKVCAIAKKAADSSRYQEMATLKARSHFP